MAKKILIVLLVLLIACIILAIVAPNEATLFSNLSDDQANSVLVVLKENNIEVKKISSEKGSGWDVVLANEDDLAKAASICKEEGVPKSSFEKIMEKFNKNSK